MQVTTGLEGDGLRRFAEAVAALGSESQASRAYRMAINQVGGRARTATIRALAKQTGLTQQAVKIHGDLREFKASNQALGYQLVSSGRPLPLKLFKPSQKAFGVVASPWGKRQRFPGAFIFAGTYKSGQPVHGGQVLHRAGKKRTLVHKRGDAAWHGKRFQPWKIMYGPSIPQEMVQDASAKAWEAAAAKLPAQLDTIIAKMTNGTIKG